MTQEKRALVYTRVSRDDSGEGKSNERQREVCLALAKARGWDVIPETFDDISVSAYTGKERPAWNRVLAAMREQRVDYVIAWQLDRITRTVRELTSLVQLARDTGVAIVTSTGDLDLSNESGKFLATVLSAVAEMEVERKGARQRLANSHSASHGKPWQSGWRPFGFTMDMTHVPEEAGLIREAAADVLAGASLKSIAREWRAAGVDRPRSKRGSDGWTHQGVKAILLNPRNAGLSTYRGEVVGKGQWEPILSEELHYQLVAVLTDSKRLVRKTGSHGRTPMNLLSGLALCAKCGKTVNAGSSNGKPVYKCPSDHVTTPRAEADAIVKSTFAVTAMAALPGMVLDLPEAVDQEGLWRAMAALDTRQVTIAAAYADGSLGREAWEKGNESINREKGVLEERLAASQLEGFDPKALQREGVASFLEMTVHQQRAILREVAEVTLHPRSRKKNVPIERQVSMFLHITRGGKKRVMAALVEHPDAATAHKQGRSLWTDAPAPRAREEQQADLETLLSHVRVRKAAMAARSANSDRETV